MLGVREYRVCHGECQEAEGDGLSSPSAHDLTWLCICFPDKCLSTRENMMRFPYRSVRRLFARWTPVCTSMPSSSPWLLHKMFSGEVKAWRSPPAPGWVGGISPPVHYVHSYSALRMQISLCARPGAGPRWIPMLTPLLATRDCCDSSGRPSAFRMRVVERTSGPQFPGLCPGMSFVTELKNAVNP